MPGRLLVLDADIAKRVATELNTRGRPAISVYTLSLAEKEDPDLLEALYTEFGTCGNDWSLATADDRMPYVHQAAVSTSPIAISTVDPRRAPGYRNTDEWRRDIVHRWAHAMQEQAPGTVRRYSLKSYRAWVPRKHYALEPPVSTE